TVNLKRLVDWTIDKYYPHISGNKGKVILWFREVVERTAALIVDWMRVGFVHGVMNTDNMSMLVLTIDCVLYSFVDDYDPDFTPNTTDLPGKRYAFGKQASVGMWNLNALAGALVSLFDGTEQLKAALEEYQDIFWGKYFLMMTKKLGLDRFRP